MDHTKGNGGVVWRASACNKQEHIRNIFDEGELPETTTISKMEIVVNRDFSGKQNVMIYDYVDIHVPVLEKMYHKVQYPSKIYHH